MVAAYLPYAAEHIGSASMSYVTYGRYAPIVTPLHARDALTQVQNISNCYTAAVHALLI